MYFDPTEDISDYKPGGLHPVHLGDTFSNGRYAVVDKLGYGSTSTTWLVFDAQTNTFASLKILSAARPLSELSVLQHLAATYDSEEEGSQHVARMLDHFVVDGPNGRHQCFVGEALGPSFGGYLMHYLCNFWDDGRFPSDIAHRICGQLALAVAYLHKHGVAHGDIHPGNVLLHFPYPRTSIEDFRREFGEPKKIEYDDDDSDNASDSDEDEEDAGGSDDDNSALSDPHRPDYLVLPLTSAPNVFRDCLRQANIKICDFGESYMEALPNPPKLATPRLFRPPEALPILALAPHATPELDIWALANFFSFLLSSGHTLFPNRGAKDDHGQLSEMALKLGPFPEPLWSKWEKRGEVLDDNGKPVDSRRSCALLDWHVNYILAPDSEDRRSFESILRSMLCYDSATRARAADVLASVWFKECCRPVMTLGAKYAVDFRFKRDRVRNGSP
ncbi:Protein kinase [Mycena kentingensis (nom. inval.)]|nr:Protein kinase [Mycena kentingensis (nom. inval.)]